MYIHKLGKGTSPYSLGLGKNRKVARDHKRTMGEGLVDKIYEDGMVHRPTDTLRNLKIIKPRIPKKYISLEV